MYFKFLITKHCRVWVVNVFFIFDSLAEANNFIKSKVKENLELELVLYNYKGKVVSVENRFGREEIKSKKPLWKFW